MDIPGGDFLERFWSKVEKTDGCWNWTGKRDREGYGEIHVGRKYVRCHRMSYRIARGDFPDNLRVLHKCDNPSCVNPSHLFLGTDADNMRDKCMKNRQARGEKGGNTKLRESQVMEIRELYKTMTARAIAKRFGISKITVRFIVWGKMWKHLPVLKYDMIHKSNITRINPIFDKAMIQAYIEKIKELVSKMDESAFIVPPTDD